jgi:uncharacterized protein YidB (DUF937 family)
MAGVEDMLRSAVPGGNIAKPLMLALGALLASGAQFRGGGAGQTASTEPQTKSDEGDGGVLGGLGGLLNKLEQGGLGKATSSWVGPVKISRSHLVSSVRRLAPISSRHFRRNPASPRMS